MLAHFFREILNSRIIPFFREGNNSRPKELQKSLNKLCSNFQQKIGKF